MTRTPESSSTNQQSGRTSDIEAGLKAFQQGDYATAVLLLEPALTAPLNNPLTVRAQMAIAIAYEKLGETTLAVEICQSLQQAANAQVQEWASRTLASLIKRHPELSSLVESPPEAQQPHPANSSTQIADEAGFAPIDADSLRPSETFERKQPGFTPLSEAPNHSTTSASSTQTPTSVGLPSFTAQPSPTKVDESVSPPPTSPDVDLPASPTLYQPVWRQAERAQQWKSLGKVNVLRLLAMQTVTAIALAYSIQQFLYTLFTFYGNMLIRTLPKLGFRVDAPETPTWPLPFTAILLIVLLIGSRWLIDAVLIFLHGMKPLSLNSLATYSPETARSLNRFCRKAGVAMPALGVLPVSAPMAFTYGVIPQVSRTVVSQGLLEQLEDDEITTIYANEVAHLSYWTVPLMSMALGALLIPYTLYQTASEWGNRKQAAVTKASAAFISVISYGLFWLLRWVPLWLSRQRAYYSDRMATELTGNPNGYARALLKMAIGTANEVETQGKTSYWLEAFEIATPLSHKMGTFLGSLYPHMPLEPVLEWERSNPFRQALVINNSHPPTGERLHLLMLYARHWKLNTELDWKDLLTRRPKSAGFTGQQWRILLSQGAPYFGLLLGVVIAFVLYALGWIGNRAQWATISWIANDQTLLLGLPLIGFCLGTLLRINPFFPDITPKSLHQPEKDGTFANLVNNPQAVPINSQAIQLHGKLLGRSGIANLFNQDLLLQTKNGIFKLHYTSRLGPCGNPFPKAVRPGELVKQSVKVQGWFRRGVTPWVDVDVLSTERGRSLRSYHPVWALTVAAFAAVVGILIILDF